MKNGLTDVRNDASIMNVRRNMHNAEIDEQIGRIVKLIGKIVNLKNLDPIERDEDIEYMLALMRRIEKLKELLTVG